VISLLVMYGRMLLTNIDGYKAVEVRFKKKA
jgi:hypothetical protein